MTVHLLFTIPVKNSYPALDGADPETEMSDIACSQQSKTSSDVDRKNWNWLGHAVMRIKRRHKRVNYSTSKDKTHGR
jgi:hypothetical protein